MQSVGQKLREARLRRKLTLEQVSSSTRISLKNLHAIEADELSKISSSFFYKSFVRQFAEEVKLDYEMELANDVQAAASQLPEPLMPGQGDAPLPKGKPLRPAKPMRLRWLSSVGGLVVMVVACSTLYAMWENSKSTLGARVQTLVKQLAEVAKKTPDAKPLASEPTEIAQATPAPLPAAEPPADSGASASSAAVTPPNGSPALQPDQQAPKQGTEPASEDGFKIELDATERAWLSVTADGKQVYNGILEPDQTKVLEGRDTAKVKTGNAGGVQVVFNGKAIGTLGPRGQVRTVVFTKDHYEIIEAAQHIALAQYVPSAALIP